MLAFLNGILREKYEGMAVIECGGFGYEVYLTSSAFASLPEEDEQVKLPTYLLIREDEWLIFGFSSVEEKNLFLQLITVSGVGAKSAVQILSGVKQSDLVGSIVNGDTHIISSVKGVGKKTAERIVLELKDKLNPYEYVLPLFDDRSDADQTAINEAVVVLTSLGVSKQQATNIARKVAETTDTAEQIVAKSLRNLGN